MSLTEEEIERYARHIVLREIGGPGQQRLKRARVLAIGAGGLGSPLLLYLAAAGVGTLGIVDDDVVSLSNLQRQILHDTARIGEAKTESALGTLQRVNPNVSITRIAERITIDNARRIVTDYDLVVDGSDSFATRYVVNAACAAEAKPWVFGAMSQWEGQVSLFDPARGGPCYACIFPEPPEPGLAPACAEAGIIGALPGIIGSMMALEAIKHITGCGRTLQGRLLLYDGLDAQCRQIRLHASPDCRACGASRAPDVQAS
jgi:molybdopterin-synthase adenylyltransferase